MHGDNFKSKTLHLIYFGLWSRCCCLRNLDSLSYKVTVAKVSVTILVI